MSVPASWSLACERQQRPPRQLEPSPRCPCGCGHGRSGRSRGTTVPAPGSHADRLAPSAARPS
eukprot:10537547-Heterocapsa_arctica.AAC.1